MNVTVTLTSSEAIQLVFAGRHELRRDQRKRLDSPALASAVAKLDAAHHEAWAEGQARRDSLARRAVNGPPEPEPPMFEAIGFVIVDLEEGGDEP